MSQGTISVLFGCHSVVHSVLVLIAWVKLYGRLPKFWQLACIFLHDIGHIGLNYLDDFEQKKKHWILGARIARVLFGEKGYAFIAGHCTDNGQPLSDLHRPDKYSYYIAPTWWLMANLFFEPKLGRGFAKMEAIMIFREQVRESIETNTFRSSHQMYLEYSNEANREAEKIAS